MTSKQRAVAKIVIQILIAVEIVNAAALPVLYKQRIRRIETVIASYSEGNPFARSLMRLARFWSSFLVSR